jgi:hypothetical protein
LLKLSDILLSVDNIILNAIKDTDFSNINIISKDFSNGVTRPSFRVLYSSRKGRLNRSSFDRTIKIIILFYAKDRYRYKLDNLEIQDILENAFIEPIAVTNSNNQTCYLSYANTNGEIDDIDFEVVDTVLHCSFNLYSIEDVYDDSSLEDMEDLVINLSEES